MSKLKNTLLLLGVQFCFGTLYSQGIFPLPGNTTVCPKQGTFYTAQPPSQVQGCGNFQWTISGGTFNNDPLNPVTTANTGNNNTVTAYWTELDASGAARGTLSVTMTCGQDSYNASGTYFIKTLKGLNPNARANNRIDFCTVNQVSLYCDVMYLPNTPVPGSPYGAESASGYEWEIPSGWSFSGSGNTNIVNISPADGCTEGTARVRAYMDNCNSGRLYSNWSSPITIRNPISSTISVPSGYSGPKCADTTPVTFTAANLSCATQFQWSISNTGWHLSSPSTSFNGTTNTITLQPSGTPADDAVLTVNIILPWCTKTQTYRLFYNDNAPLSPGIGRTSYNFELCDFESVQYVATPPSGLPTNFGFDWYTTDGLLVNGAAATETSPVATTTTNAATISAKPGGYGRQWVFVRTHKPGCAASIWAHMETRVGPYSNEEFSIIGPQYICPNTAVDFNSSYIDSDIYDYEWSAPADWSSSGQGTPYFHVSIPPWVNGYDNAITLRLANRCGYTNTPFVYPVYTDFCGWFASPNPASSTLSITDLVLNEGEKAEATLMDKQKNKIKTAKYKEGKIEMDVSNVPNGPYIIVLKYKDRTESKNVMIQH
jgi:hypothetical protein